MDIIILYDVWCSLYVSILEKHFLRQFIGIIITIDKYCTNVNEDFFAVIYRV